MSFTGLYEQHFIAHGMMYAACLGGLGGDALDEEDDLATLKHVNCPSSGDCAWKRGSFIIGFTVVLLIIFNKLICPI